MKSPAPDGAGLFIVWGGKSGGPSPPCGCRPRITVRERLSKGPPPEDVGGESSTRLAADATPLRWALTHGPTDGANGAVRGTDGAKYATAVRRRTSRTGPDGPALAGGPVPHSGGG